MQVTAPISHIRIFVYKAVILTNRSDCLYILCLILWPWIWPCWNHSYAHCM